MNTNQIIHERLMGGCWHEKGERSQDEFYKHYCSKCGKLVRFILDDWLDRPEYDSDLSPCFAAQTKAIERFGMRYIDAIAETCGANRFGGSHQFSQKYKAFVEASAEQRCAAIVKLLEKEEQERKREIRNMMFPMARA